jgi:hypothetical protein
VSDVLVDVVEGPRAASPISTNYVSTHFVSVSRAINKSQLQSSAATVLGIIDPSNKRKNINNVVEHKNHYFLHCAEFPNSGMSSMKYSIKTRRIVK